MQYVPDTQIKIPGIGAISALATNANGDVFVKAESTTGIQEYEPSGIEESTPVGGEFDTGSSAVKAVAVDPTTGDVYVVDNGSGVYVKQYNSSGTLLAESESGLLEESTGLAVSKSGTVYAADTSAAANKVLMFGVPPTTGLPAPSVGSAPLAQDGSRSAQAQASINPHFGESYVLRGIWGRKLPYGKRAPGAPSVLYVPGETNTVQTVSVALEGLASGAEYHYRFVAENSAADQTAFGPDETFVTDAEGITGLPDGRVFEQVSPVFKNGNFFDPVTGWLFGLAEAGGDGVVYPMSGPVGVSGAGIVDEYVSRRVPGTGWSTEQATPRPVGEVVREASPSFMLPSADFTRFLFGDEEPFVGEQDGVSDEARFANIFVGTGSVDEPEWLTRPVVASPVPAPGVGQGTVSGGGQNYVIAGAAPDLHRVYFSYAGTLLPEDAERAAHVGSGLSTGEGFSPDPWGYYEYSNGLLREAGTLPDGKQNPFGAVPGRAGPIAYPNWNADAEFPGGRFRQCSLRKWHEVVLREPGSDCIVGD